MCSIQGCGSKVSASVNIRLCHFGVWLDNGYARAFAETCELGLHTDL